MRMAKYILPTLILLFCASIPRAAEMETILARRAQAALLPPSDTVILYHGTTFTIHDDGRLDHQEHIVRYLRTKNAWDDYGDPHLAFHSGRQELEVPISRTYTPDGKRVDTTPNGFNPIVPFGLDLAPDFTAYRQMVVTHLGIVDDAVTELKYIVRDTEPLYPWAWGEVLLAGREPVLERELIVQVPKGLALRCNEENDAPPGIRRVDGEMEAVTWRMADLPGYDLAETGQKSRLYLPRVSFSTCPNWETLTAEMQKRFEAALEHRCSFVEELDPWRNISNREILLDSALTFVKDRVALKRFNDLGMLLNIRPACRTYKTGYGGPADLAALHAAVLTELGFAPQVYLVATGALAVPGLTGDEYYLIFLNDIEPGRWLDPSSGKISYRPPEGATLIGVWPAESPQVVITSPHESNRVQLDLNITFEADGSAQGHLLVKEFGQLAQYETARSKGAEKVIGQWTDALLSGPEIKNAQILYQQPDRVEAQADLALPAPEDLIDGILRLTLPWSAPDVDGLLPHNLALHQPHRNVPVYLDHAGSIELHLAFHVPDDWTVVLTPAAYSLSANGVSFDRSVKSEPGAILIHEKVMLPEPIIPAQNWEDWRQILLLAQKESTRTLLLQTGG